MTAPIHVRPVSVEISKLSNGLAGAICVFKELNAPKHKRDVYRPGQTEKKALAMWASGFKFLLAHKKIHSPTSSSLVSSPFRVELT